MLKPLIPKKDKLAKRLIILVSVIIFLAVVALDRHLIQPEFPFEFDVHYFALANSIINSAVALLLLAALFAAKSKQFLLHRNLMFGAILLSVLFLVSYIAHHLYAGDTSFGGEGWIRPVYYTLLITHIVLAALILPFILFTAYRALTGEWQRHKKIARYTWPLWFYVSVSGVVVYWMIRPYYG